MQVFLLLLGLMFSLQVAGKESLPVAHVNPSTTQLDLTPYAWVIVDSEHLLGIEDIANPGLLKFKPLSETGNSFGFDKSVYWVKFSISFDALLSESIFLNFNYPVIDSITLFSENRNGGFNQSISGDIYPFAQRELNFRDYLFLLEYRPGETRNYYMRLHTKGSMQIPLSVWTSSALIELTNASSLTYGFYYGVMVLLMIAAATAYLVLGDLLFLTYALYLFSFILFQLSMNGFAFEYLWPDSDEWPNRLNSATLGAVVFFGFLFCGTFLRVWQKQDRFKYFYLTLMGVGLLSVLLSLLGDYAIALVAAASAGILLPPIVLLSGIYAVMAGYKPARFFLLAWGIFLIGAFSAGLVYFGWIDRNFITHNSMQIGSLIEVMILGYVLMENVRQLNAQKIVATLEARQYLEQLNQGLETLVEERTRELNQKNRQLSELAIRDSMTGLLNHNASIEQLNQLKKSAQRYRHELSVVMIDIDYFKAINDRYGHPSGDQVILCIADVLKHSLRNSDVSGRYGGEEFILLFPQTGAAGALKLSESILHKIRALKIVEINQNPVTVSIGVATFDAQKPVRNLIDSADTALYQAKQKGRNQVVLLN